MNPSKGDFYKIIHSVEGKSIGKIVQLIEKSNDMDIMWLARASEPLSTVGGTKETLVWVPLDWMEPVNSGMMQ